MKGAAECEFQLIFVGSPWLAFRMFPSPSWDTSPFFTHEHLERAAWQITAQGIGQGFLGWVQRNGTHSGTRSQEEVGFLEEVTLKARVGPASLEGV